MATSSVQKMASDLAVDITQYPCGVIITLKKDECTLIMRRCADKMLTNYQYKFNGLIKLIVNDDDDTDIVVVFLEVIKHMLKQGPMNWGHIVSIYAFTAQMTQHLLAPNPNNKDAIIETMTEVWSGAFSHELENSIMEQEGFDSFVQAFGNCSNPENSIFKGLFTAIVTVGLCALAVKVFHE